jgi:hypothetical protein
VKRTFTFKTKIGFYFMAIKDKVHDLIAQEFSGLEEPQRTAFIEYAVAAVEFATAADDYSDESANNQGDDDAEAAAGDALVDVGGSISSAVTPAKRDAFLAAIKKLYTDPDPLLEIAGENLLDKTVAYREKARAVAALFPPA